MNAGRIEAQGTYNELRSSNNHKLFDTIDNEEPHDADCDQDITPALQKKIATSAVAQNIDQKQEAHIEKSTVGLQMFGVLKKYFQNVNNGCVVAFVVAIIVLAQTSNTFVSLYIAKW